MLVPYTKRCVVRVALSKMMMEDDHQKVPREAPLYRIMTYKCAAPYYGGGAPCLPGESSRGLTRARHIKTGVQALHALLG